MNIAKLRNSTAVDKAFEVAAVNTALKAAETDNQGAQTQADKPAQVLPPAGDLTAKSVSAYLHGISAHSCNEIDALISDLCGLREKLVTDSDRIERDVVEFATLNQSIIKLTEVIVDSVTHVKSPSVAE
jgi:hypothetical protein